MRHLLWVTLAASALLGGCDNQSEIHIRTSSTSSTQDASILKAIDTLQCPQTEDLLTRKGSADANGRSCTYAGPRGTEVLLQLVSLDNRSAEETLRRIEAELSVDLPEAASAIKNKVKAEANAAREQALRDRDEAFSEGTDTASEPATANEDSAHVRLPGMSVDSKGDRAVVRLPGMKIEADGDRSEVRIGGIVIRSDSKEDTSQITIPDGASSNTESVTIDANRTATRIRAMAPGESIRATYRLVLNRERGSNWRAVGYEARGPAGGPIVVAVVRSRAENDDRVFDAAKALVTLNVGK